MNATERIRAALQKPATTQGSPQDSPQGTEVSAHGMPAESLPPEPVETTLRLIATDDQQRASMGEPVAAPQAAPVQPAALQKGTPAQPKDAPAQGPAVTVKLLRSSLIAGEEIRVGPARREAVPAPAPAKTSAPAPVQTPAPGPAAVAAKVATPAVSTSAVSTPAVSTSAVSTSAVSTSAVSTPAVSTSAVSTPAPAQTTVPVKPRVQSATPVQSAEADTELRMWAADVPARRKGLTMWMLIGGAVALIAILAIVFRSAWLPARTVSTEVSALQLGVESEDNGLISLRWNAQSMPVVQAREGRLSIVEDQKAPRTVPMSQGQLGAGHLFYESSSDRVQFQLEVVEKSGAVVRESVVAAKKPEPTAPAGAATQTPQQVAAANPASPLPTANTPGQDAAAQIPPPGEAPKPAQPAPRTFTPPPVPAARDRAGEGRVILMEPAPTLGGGSALPSGALLPGRVDIIPPPPPAPTAPPRGMAPSQTQAAKAAPPAPQRVKVGGRLQSAMLLRKVEPTYPAMARQMRIQGIVRFQAVIGKEGEVEDLQFVSGPRALEKAASDAVKRWVYRPTLLNGRPVEVSTQIDIDFTLGN